MGTETVYNGDMKYVFTLLACSSFFSNFKYSILFNWFLLNCEIFKHTNDVSSYTFALTLSLRVTVISYIVFGNPWKYMHVCRTYIYLLLTKKEYEYISN